MRSKRKEGFPESYFWFTQLGFRRAVVSADRLELWDMEVFFYDFENCNADC
jgi:N-acetylglutamate synthase-like GNAT family acetyltransferase